MKGQYSKLYKKGVSLFMTAACVCALMAGCGQGEEEEVMSEVIPVQVQQPEAGSLTLKNEFMGTISPEEAVYVISMVSAEVLSTNVSVGDVVSAGDVLCELDSEAAELQLASAQVQYNSAAAGVNAAQVGYEMAQSQYEMAQSQYEMAQSQYEGTIAQLDAQMGGQKNLQLYQLQIQVENIQANIDDIYAQKADLEEQKENAEEKKSELNELRNQANSSLQMVTEHLEKVKQEKTKLDVMTDSDKRSTFGEALSEEQLDFIYEQAVSEAQTALDNVQSLYEQASVAASQANTAYSQLVSGIESMEDGQEQLDDALENANRGLQQAEAVMNITEEQIYNDTQKIVDANKKTAALSLDSAALGINSAALGIDSAAASVNSAKIGVEGAQVAIDSAKYQLDMYTLKAPIDGVIEAVNVDAHAFASPSSPAFVISNKDTMTVTFYVSEGIRNTLTVGQKVSVDRNGKLFDAAITEIGSMVDQTTGLFAIKACVSAPDESLLTGCSVKITADTYSQDSVILIPYDAVYYDDSQAYVYVAVGGVAERRNIETGIFDEQTITVLSGLTTEEQLITSWSANLREGALISIQSAKDSADSEE